MILVLLSVGLFLIIEVDDSTELQPSRSINYSDSITTTRSGSVLQRGMTC